MSFLLHSKGPLWRPVIRKIFAVRMKTLKEFCALGGLLLCYCTSRAPRPLPCRVDRWCYTLTRHPDVSPACPLCPLLCAGLLYCWVFFLSIGEKSLIPGSFAEIYKLNFSRGEVASWLCAHFHLIPYIISSSSLLYISQSRNCSLWRWFS